MPEEVVSRMTVPDCEDSKRVLMDSEDGKHHCYAFYLLGEK